MVSSRPTMSSAPYVQHEGRRWFVRDRLSSSSTRIPCNGPGLGPDGSRNANAVESALPPTPPKPPHPPLFPGSVPFRAQPDIHDEARQDGQFQYEEVLHPHTFTPLC